MSAGEERGIPSVAVKCVDIGRNTSGEGAFLDCVMPYIVSRANACTVASELNSIVLSSESRHELIAIDTKMKLAIWKFPPRFFDSDSTHRLSPLTG